MRPALSSASASPVSIGTISLGRDLGELEEQARGQVGAAAVAADGHPLAGQVVEVADALAAEQ